MSWTRCSASHCAAGFTAVGINAERTATGIRCHELLAFIVGGDESHTLASAERLADRAQTIGAEWVRTVLTEKVPPSRIERCAKVFDRAGAGMAVEYTPLGAIPTTSDGMEYVRAASRSARRTGAELGPLSRERPRLYSIRRHVGVQTPS